MLYTYKQMYFIYIYIAILTYTCIHIHTYIYMLHTDVDAKKLEHTHPDIQRSMSERVQVPILAFCSKVGTF